MLDLKSKTTMLFKKKLKVHSSWRFLIGFLSKILTDRKTDFTNERWYYAKLESRAVRWKDSGLLF